MPNDPRRPPRGGDPTSTGRCSPQVHAQADVGLDPSVFPESWPAHGIETRPWAQGIRAGTREDRMLRSVDVSLPPHIADEQLVVSSQLASDIERAMHGITSLDQGHAGDLEGLGTMLLRNIYHYWFHTGEVHAMRQVLGHTNLPQFVGDMSLAKYDF